MNKKEQSIRRVVYDDNNIVDYVKNSPQTYNSILQDFKDNGTMQVVLRRRISRLLKQNRLWKMRVPGTRFGLVLFCTPEHDYKMLTFDGLGKTRIFYMYNFEEDNKNFILENYWELKGPNWSKWKYFNDVITIPKLGDRNSVVRLWQ